MEYITTLQTLLENMGQALMTMTTVEDNNTVSDTDDSEYENGENTENHLN